MSNNCTSPPSVTNGFFVIAKIVYEASDNVHYYCMQGYERSGTNAAATLTCDGSSGTWTGTTPTCTAATTSATSVSTTDETALYYRSVWLACAIGGIIFTGFLLYCGLHLSLLCRRTEEKSILGTTITEGCCYNCCQKLLSCNCLCLADSESESDGEYESDVSLIDIESSDEEYDNKLPKKNGIPKHMIHVPKIWGPKTEIIPNGTAGTAWDNKKPKIISPRVGPSESVSSGSQTPDVKTESKDPDVKSFFGFWRKKASNKIEVKSNEDVESPKGSEVDKNADTTVSTETETNLDENSTPRSKADFKLPRKILSNRTRFKREPVPVAKEVIEEKPEEKPEDIPKSESPVDDSIIPKTQVKTPRRFIKKRFQEPENDQNDKSVNKGKESETEVKEEQKEEVKKVEEKTPRKIIAKKKVTPTAPVVTKEETEENQEVKTNAEPLSDSSKEATQKASILDEAVEMQSKPPVSHVVKNKANAANKKFNTVEEAPKDAVTSSDGNIDMSMV